MRNGGAAPDPSAQFSRLCLYIFEHSAFHSAQDDEMRRRVSIGQCPKVSQYQVSRFGLSKHCPPDRE
ncbi:MAG: hypothetical protein SO159_06925, partial [Dialister sp.]|nr:hypothetical protein [Dialister sp.]